MKREIIKQLENEIVGILHLDSGKNPGDSGVHLHEDYFEDVAERIANYAEHVFCARSAQNVKGESQIVVDESQKVEGEAILIHKSTQVNKDPFSNQSVKEVRIMVYNHTQDRKNELFVMHECDNNEQLISQLETLIWGLKNNFSGFATISK